MGYKLSKIYVGTNLVRPSGYHYEVDFTTLSDIPSDLTLQWEKGGTRSRDGGLKLKNKSICLVKSGLDLSSGVLTITATGNRTTTSWAGGDIIGIRDGSVSTDWDNSYTVIGWNPAFQMNYSYQSWGSAIKKNTSGSWTTLNKDTGGTTPTGGNYTYTFSLDLSSGLISCTQIDGDTSSTHSCTYTLSSSDLNTVKNRGNAIFLIISPNSITNTLYTISIDIE